MEFTQYYKITLSSGRSFTPEDKFAFDIFGPTPIFPYIVWEEGTLNIWFVSDSGISICVKDYWLLSDITSWIKAGIWIAEPMNPRFCRVNKPTPNFYMELDKGRFLEHCLEQKISGEHWPHLTVENMKYRIKLGTWKQIPPVCEYYSLKQKVIPAKKTELTDIFPTL